MVCNAKRNCQRKKTHLCCCSSIRSETILFASTIISCLTRTWKTVRRLQRTRTILCTILLKTIARAFTPLTPRVSGWEWSRKTAAIITKSYFCFNKNINKIQCERHDWVSDWQTDWLTACSILFYSFCLSHPAGRPSCCRWIIQNLKCLFKSISALLKSKPVAHCHCRDSE